MPRSAAFEFEHEFYPRVAAAAVALVSSRRALSMRRVLRETLVGRVFPDVLIGEWPSKQRPFARRRLTAVDCAVLNALDSDGSTAAALESGEHSSVVVSQAQNRLSRLGALGLAHEDATGVWKRTRDSRLDDVRLTAIEAKLARWEEALAQALTVQLFVHRAYIMLEALPSAIDHAIETLRANGVGLLVRRGANVEMVVRAASTRPVTHEWILAVDKLLHHGRTSLSKTQ